MKISDLQIGDKVHVKDYEEAEYDGTVIAIKKRNLWRMNRGEVMVENIHGTAWWQAASEITHKI